MILTIERNKDTGVVLINADGEVVNVYFPNTVDQPTIDLLDTLAAAEKIIFDMPKVENEVKVNLTQIREQAGLTLEQLADRVGCTRQTLSKIELRQTLPKLDVAIKIADVLKMDVRDLL